MSRSHYHGPRGHRRRRPTPRPNRIAPAPAAARHPAELGRLLQETHDALIRTWGDLRRGPVWWLVFGDATVATELEKLKGTRQLSGTVDQALERLENVIGAERPDVLAGLRRHIDGATHPVIVIANAEVAA